MEPAAHSTHTAHRTEEHRTRGGFTPRRNALAVVLFQRLGPMRIGHAWGRTLALFELLFQELLPRAAVRRGPLVPGHASAALLLLLPRRRRSLLVARAIRATSFVIGLRGARQGPQAGGIRRLACSTQRAACGLRSPPPCGRSMRDHVADARGARRRRGAHIHGARPLRAGGSDSLSQPRGHPQRATCDHQP
jgi:hypothetical protein